MTMALSDKTLIMVVGPAAVGKSTVMLEVEKLDQRFSYVRSFTTRPDRGDGKSTYHHLTTEEAIKLHENGATITYFQHPTTGDIYGTTLESYQNEFNLLDTLSGTVEMYRNSGFKKTTTLSMTTDPSSWRRWIQTRYPEHSLERVKRLQEAVSSIEWSLAQTSQHSWIINRPGQPEFAAKSIIAIAGQESSNSEPPSQAREILTMARDLLSYE